MGRRRVVVALGDREGLGELRHRRILQRTQGTAGLVRGKVLRELVLRRSQRCAGLIHLDLVEADRGLCPSALRVVHLGDIRVGDRLGQGEGIRGRGALGGDGKDMGTRGAHRDVARELEQQAVPIRPRMRRQVTGPGSVLADLGQKFPGLEQLREHDRLGSRRLFRSSREDRRLVWHGNVAPHRRAGGVDSWHPNLIAETDHNGKDDGHRQEERMAEECLNVASHWPTSVPHRINPCIAKCPFFSTLRIPHKPTQILSASTPETAPCGVRISRTWPCSLVNSHGPHSRQQLPFRSAPSGTPCPSPSLARALRIQRPCRHGGNARASA